MEEIHRNHKDAAWGWVAVLLGLLDGFPRHRSRQASVRWVAPRLTVRPSA